MHYVPESAREFLAEEPQAALQCGRSFHYRSAPIYLLTAIVGLLLAADFLIELIAVPEWQAYRTVFGYRLALLAAVLGGGRILYQTLEDLFEGKVGAAQVRRVTALDVAHRIRNQVRDVEHGSCIPQTRHLVVGIASLLQQADHRLRARQAPGAQQNDHAIARSLENRHLAKLREVVDSGVGP